MLAALPLVATSAKAAAVGAAAAKGSATAKAAGLIGLVNMVLIPVMGVFGTWIGYKMGVDGARSEEERAFVSRFYRILTGCIVGFIVATVGIILSGSPLAVSHPALWAGSLIAISVLYILAVMGLTLWSWKYFRAFRKAEAGGGRESTQATAWRWGLPAYEYRSKLSVLGLPLVHIRLRAGLDRGPVKAWIAAGDAAIGAIFAFGGLAVAPLSCGACSIGLLTFGGLAAGLLSMGGFSLGLWAMGAQAIGLLAFGGCALGWQAAMGGVAIARDYALGGIALADQANNAVAAAFIRNHSLLPKRRGGPALSVLAHPALVRPARGVVARGGASDPAVVHHPLIFIAVRLLEQLPRKICGIHLKNQPQRKEKNMKKLPLVLIGIGLAATATIVAVKWQRNPLSPAETAVQPERTPAPNVNRRSKNFDGKRERS